LRERASFAALGVVGAALVEVEAVPAVNEGLRDRCLRAAFFAASIGID